MANDAMYQEYLRVIGKLKDIFGLHIDVDHQDIHTFYKDKRPLFKLFFGSFSQQENPSIVISFHLSLLHQEAIRWFINVYQIHPSVALHDSYIEDSDGNTHLGEDALAIEEVYMAQEILAEWLETHTEEEIKYFATSKVVGKSKDPQKIFDASRQKDVAIMDFDKMRKPTDDDQIH